MAGGKEKYTKTFLNIMPSSYKICDFHGVYNPVWSSRQNTCHWVSLGGWGNQEEDV